MKRTLPTSPISGLTNLGNSRSKCGGFHRFVIKLIKASWWRPPSSFKDFLDWNRGCFSLWSSCSTCAVWLKYCCVYPSRSHDSTNPPRKSLSGHPFVWLSKTDKEFCFCAPWEALSLWDIPLSKYKHKGMGWLDMLSKQLWVLCSLACSVYYWQEIGTHNHQIFLSYSLVQYQGCEDSVLFVQTPKLST